jgi:pyrimidine-nucleoside phosphorylase
MIPSELIKKKKWGGVHSREEIHWLIRAFTSGELPDYQMAAWAMAVWFKGMNSDEIACLTEAMRDSGEKFDFSNLNAPRVDKHSTGGVGDKTTLIIGPILAAAQVYVPMIAGRGLGHTGGTLDKLESIPGFKINLTRREFEDYVKKYFFGLMGQTQDICPADRKLYALRDVTSTVDSLPLICGSIMSKKLAEDLTGLVLDVKFGSGAFMKTIDDAVALATLLKTTGEKNGVRVSAIISNMNEPLGRFIGNAVEVQECLDILQGKTCIENGVDFYLPTRQLSLELSGHMLWLGGKAASADEGVRLAQEILESGRALTTFGDFIERQGGSRDLRLPQAQFSTLVLSKQKGFLHAIDTEKIGLAGIALGAGRRTATDSIDYSAGIETYCRLGQPIALNQPLFRIFANDEATLAEAKELIYSSLKLKESPQNEILPLVAKVLV